MTSEMAAADLPECLYNAWRVGRGEFEKALREGDFEDWSVATLASSLLSYQLRRAGEAGNSAIPQSNGVTAEGFATFREARDTIDIETLLADPSLPYLWLRRLQGSPPSFRGPGRLLVDTDEIILRNEAFIRSGGGTSINQRSLVHLEDLPQCISGAAANPAQDGTIGFVRQIPPKGSFEVLDQFRHKDVQLWSSKIGFVNTFRRISRRILDGMDWTNVFIAGGIVLATLLHTDESKDHDREVEAPDIDLYIYGLSAEDANRKVQHIYDVWSRNVPTRPQHRLVVKNAKTITFLPTYPKRRLQVVLKLVPTSTDILTNFDLDVCALGFDGSDVVMLPRCARAIETGYSVFTMELVYDHHLGNRQASQESRLFKYAERGFGLRILPSYAKSLEGSLEEFANTHQS